MVYQHSPSYRAHPHQSSQWLSMKVSLYPMNEVPASLAPSAGPSNEPVMPPCSVEPSSPPFEVTDDGDSMNDEIEMEDGDSLNDEIQMEVDFSSKDNTNKKSSNDLVLWSGMKFASLEEFESFYHKFAISEGHTVRINRTVNFAHTDRKFIEKVLLV